MTDTPRPCETCQFFTVIVAATSFTVCKRDGRAGGYRHIPFERTAPDLCGPSGAHWIKREGEPRRIKAAPALEPRLRLVDPAGGR